MSVRTSKLDGQWSWDDFPPLMEVDDSTIEWGCRVGAASPNAKKCTHHVMVNGIRVHVSCSSGEAGHIYAVWDDDDHLVYHGNDKNSYTGWLNWDEAIAALGEVVTFYVPTEEEVEATVEGLAELLRQMEDHVH